MVGLNLAIKLKHEKLYQLLKRNDGNKSMNAFTLKHRIILNHISSYYYIQFERNTSKLYSTVLLL